MGEKIHEPVKKKMESRDWACHVACLWHLRVENNRVFSNRRQSVYEMQISNTMLLGMSN